MNPACGNGPVQDVGHRAQDVGHRAQDLGKLDRMLELLGGGVLASLIVGFIPLPHDGVLDVGREGVFPALAVFAGVIAVGIDLPSRPRRLFAIFTAVAAAHVAWVIQDMGRAAAGDPSLVAHGASAVVLTVLAIASLAVGFVSFCVAMIGASKHFGAQPATAAWQATMRLSGWVGLAVFGATILSVLGNLLDADGVVFVSVLVAFGGALAVFVKALSAGAATRRWISKSSTASL